MINIYAAANVLHRCKIKQTFLNTRKYESDTTIRWSFGSHCFCASLAHIKSELCAPRCLWECDEAPHVSRQKYSIDGEVFNQSSSGNDCNFKLLQKLDPIGIYQYSEQTSRNRKK